jgi:hypothetical protein
MPAFLDELQPQSQAAVAVHPEPDTGAPAAIKEERASVVAVLRTLFSGIGAQLCAEDAWFRDELAKAWVLTGRQKVRFEWLGGDHFAPFAIWRLCNFLSVPSVLNRTLGTR